MNAFGHRLRVQIFGESHGPYVGIVIDGVPPGIALQETDFAADLLRRQGGNQAGTTPRKESDQPQLISGIFQGFTTGAPVTILFANQQTQSADYAQMIQQPRPGHADWVAAQKFKGYQDYRGGGHFSGRLTVCLVAAGVLAKKILHSIPAASNLSIEARLIEAGGHTDIDLAIEQALAANDSIGGLVECTVQGMPVGLGEPFFDSIESMLSHALFAIPAIKGIEFGSGFAAARMTGSTHNDAIVDAKGTTATNYSGGINGGISNGNPLLFRVAVKPASSTPQEQQTLNMASGKIEPVVYKGRHDLCIALRVPVVVEAVTALVLADFCL
jgi:chorismate synthase